MIEDYQPQLETYAFPESIEATRKYLRKYWLSKQEYLSKWKSVQSRVFSEKEFPKMVFNQGYQRLICKGGMLIEQTEFELLKECFQLTNDSYLIIVEDFNELDPPHDSGPLLRFRYPVNITWEEINIGEGISYELYQRPIRNFFVFGDTGNWGKYAANEHEFPLDIFGFKKEYEKIFRNRFEMTEKERNELKKFIPKEYI